MTSLKIDATASFQCISSAMNEAEELLKHYKPGKKEEGKATSLPKAATQAKIKHLKETLTEATKIAQQTKPESLSEYALSNFTASCDDLCKKAKELNTVLQEHETRKTKAGPLGKMLTSLSSSVQTLHTILGEKSREGWEKELSQQKSALFTVEESENFEQLLETTSERMKKSVLKALQSNPNASFGTWAIVKDEENNTFNLLVLRDSRAKPLTVDTFDLEFTKKGAFVTDPDDVEFSAKFNDLEDFIEAQHKDSLYLLGELESTKFKPTSRKRAAEEDEKEAVKSEKAVVAQALEKMNAFYKSHTTKKGQEFSLQDLTKAEGAKLLQAIKQSQGALESAKKSGLKNWDRSEVEKFVKDVTELDGFIQDLFSNLLLAAASTGEAPDITTLRSQLPELDIKGLKSALKVT